MGIFKKISGRLVDVRVDKWMSWDYLEETALRFKSLFMDIVIPQKANIAETFEEAKQRLDLTEADIAMRKKEFTRLFYFFLVLALAILGYALTMAVKGSMTTSLIAFCLALYALTQAFRFHFWLFQLKVRKLGCTLKEWMNSTVVDLPKQDLVVKNEPQDIVEHHDKQKKAKE